MASKRVREFHIVGTIWWWWWWWWSCVTRSNTPCFMCHYDYQTGNGGKNGDTCIFIKRRKTCICTVSERRWARMHFGRPCWSVHGSSWMSLGSGGNRLRPSDMDSGKPTFMSCAPRPASSNLRGLSPHALTLLEGAKFIAWRLRRLLLGECRRSPRHFKVLSFYFFI